jgi:hypothetical protein
VKPWDFLADEDTGELDRHFEAMWPMPAKVWLDGHRLVWSMPHVPYFYPVPGVKASNGLLADFLPLAEDQTGEAILRFARRWGVLPVCDHGRPPRHGDQNREPTRCLPRGAIGGGEEWALLESPWRTLSATAGALMRIAVAVEDGQPGSLADWRVAHPDSLASWWGIPTPWVSDASRPGISAEDDRYWVSAALGPWLSGPQVIPSFVWTHHDREWQLLPQHQEWHGLYGALGVALMLAIARARDLRICRNCGKLYGRGAEMRNYRYCKDCGIRASWKLSKRRQRNSARGVPPKAEVIRRKEAER